MSNVTFNVPLVKARLDACIELSQVVLDEQVVKDSNYYAPFKEGELVKSGIANIGVKPGSVSWTQPYAGAQYYGLPNKSKKRNPHASMKWFEVAKARWKKDWIKMANKGGGFSE